ncbi:MAG: hypothetical protein ACFFDM_08970 [Candidatus Thorarchaeota archaeon]
MNQNLTCKEVYAISSFSSKYFGWLIALAIVIIGGWFLLPDGYNDLIAIFAPQFGNYLRPTMVMVNLILVNPMSNFTMVAIWAGAGFVGGAMAGTKKGAFVVGLMVWLSCLGIIALCVYLLFQTGITLGSFVVPPGSSIVDILGIPLIQGMIDQILPLISGMGMGFDLSSIMTLLTPLLIWFLTPVIVVIVAAIVGAVVRPKEEF